MTNNEGTPDQPEERPPERPPEPLEEDLPPSREREPIVKREKEEDDDTEGR